MSIIKIEKTTIDVEHVTAIMMCKELFDLYKRNDKITTQMKMDLLDLSRGATGVYIQILKEELKEMEAKNG